jgi:hypothetical protein
MEYQNLKTAIRTLGYATEVAENRETTRQTLRRLLYRARKEKIEPVLKKAGGSAPLRRPRRMSAGEKSDSAPQVVLSGLSVLPVFVPALDAEVPVHVFAI